MKGKLQFFGRGSVKRLKQKGEESDVALRRITISIQSAFYSVPGPVLCAPQTPSLSSWGRAWGNDKSTGCSQATHLWPNSGPPSPPPSDLKPRPADLCVFKTIINRMKLPPKEKSQYLGDAHFLAHFFRLGMYHFGTVGRNGLRQIMQSV